MTENYRAEQIVMEALEQDIALEIDDEPNQEATAAVESLESGGRT